MEQGWIWHSATPGEEKMTIPVLIKTRPVKLNEEAIRILHDYLDFAKDGRIAGIAIAAIEPNGSSLTEASETDSFQGLLGAIEILKFRMISNRGKEV
jgi:hypothetical protein